jgi:hypothetical protein
MPRLLIKPEVSLLEPANSVYPARTMGPAAVFLALGLWLLWCSPAAAEITVGINGGWVIPGDQDLTFKEYPSDGGWSIGAENITARKIVESVGPIVGAQVTAWGNGGLLRHLGLQLEPLYWYVDTSGVPTPLRLSKHQDTRFVPVLFGLDWRF